MAATIEAPTDAAGRHSFSRFSPEGWAARRGIHYGWLIVFIAFLVVVTGAGVRSAPGVLIQPLEREFGWSRSEISLGIALSLLVFGLAAPISGRIAERVGLRVMTIGFIALGAAGVTLCVFISSLWQFYLFWGLVVGFGTGGVATVLTATVANTWFEKRRGLVTGMLGGAASAGQLIFLPLLVAVASTWGWRSAVALLAVVLGGLVLPLVVLILRSRPSDVGLGLYGATAASTAALADSRITPVREAVRTLDFWLLSSTFFVCGFTTMGLIGAHFIPHATEHGFSEAQAAGILSVIGGMNVVGTITSGWLCDRYSPRVLLASYYFFRALSLLLLPFISTMELMSVFAVLYGFDYIATVPPTVMLTADRFGRRSVGTIYGWISFSHMVGGAVASYLAGYIHDVAGEYTVAFYLAGLLGLMASALAFGIKQRPRAIPAPALSTG